MIQNNKPTEPTAELEQLRKRVRELEKQALDYERARETPEEKSNRNIVEQRLGESEERFRSIVENSLAGIFIVDSTFRFTYANDVFCAIMGYAREEVLGHDFREFLDEGSKRLVAERYVRRQRGESVPPRYEFRIVRKDGEVRDVELSSAVISGSAGHQSTVGQILDITDRKRDHEALQKAYAELESRVEQRTADLRNANVLLQQQMAQRKEIEEALRGSEARYRNLVETANCIVLEWDAEGLVTFFNRFAGDFFGFPAEEIIGRHVVGTIVAERDAEGRELMPLIRDIIANPDIYYSSENENMRRNGEKVWIAWTNKGIRDEAGRLKRILSIGIDRTEQKRMQGLLEQQAEEAATARERNRLARDLHDAVSQTLFSASLIAEVLPRLWERDREEGKRRLDEIRHLTRGALAEMRTLLLELRPAAMEDADLGDLLKQLAESLAGRVTAPVTVEAAGQCPMTPEAKAAFYRIAQEALNNIAKHAEASEANVSLKCDSTRATLLVSDNGRGFNLKKSSSESMGLRIMRERADGIGAMLTVTSKAGQGTKVKVTWQNTAKEQ